MQQDSSIKKCLAYCCIILLFIYGISCKHELSFEGQLSSEGFLSKDVVGNCKPITVSGNYSPGKNLNDSNFLEAEVTVTTTGAYSIFSDTVNGYYFKANGTFTSTGLVTVKLPAYGTPILNDTDHFTLQYNSSTCEAFVNAGSTNDKLASFTLQGSPGNCLNDTVYGSYYQDTLLSTDSKIEISADVTAPGKYSITTDTINGYSFSATGTFLNTGIQTFFLTAIGTPIKTGIDIFTVHGSISSCSFNVPVITVSVVTNFDYFPLSALSEWTYDDLLHPGDSLTKAVKGTSYINGNLYHIMEENDGHNGPVNFYYRKDGLKYFEYAATDKFTSFSQFNNPVNDAILFLEENINTGTTWQSPEYTDTAANNSVMYLQYNFSCIDANATVLLNANTFSNVYKIKMLPYIKKSSNNYRATGEEYIIYYAKGIGMIYFRETLSGITEKELQLRSWIVN